MILVNLKNKIMKNSIKAIAMIAVFGILVVFTIACAKKCNTNCCKTATCKQHCIKEGCCKEDATCDITDHKECKHKCCDIDKKECHVEGEKPCCKTKK